MVKLSGIKSQIRGARGHVRQRRSDWAGAAKSFEAAAVRNPQDAALWFRSGNAYFRADDLEKAKETLRKAVEHDPEQSDWWYRLGFVLERSGKYEEALQAYSAAGEVSGTSGKLAFRQARCHAKLGNSEQAAVQYRVAVGMNHQKKKSYEALGSLEDRLTPTWQKLELRRQGQSEFDAGEHWTLEHARLAYAMAQWAEAAETFAAVDAQVPLVDNDRFLYALSLENVDDRSAARAELSLLLKRLPKVDQPFGPAAVFQKRGFWSRARAELQSLRVPKTSEAERLYRIGLSYDREYKWEQAKEYYQAALLLDPTKIYWNYKCGHACERLGEFGSAAGWYLNALELDPSSRYYWFRAAKTLSGCGRDDAALKAAKRSLGVKNAEEIVMEPLGEEFSEILSELRAPHVDLVREVSRMQMDAPQGASPTALMHWAENEDAAGNSETANALLTRALRCLRELDEEGWGRAVSLLERQYQPAKALEVALENRIFQLPDGVDIKRYLKGVATRRERVYAEFRKTRPVNDHVVMFESNHGASAGCHPLALYRWIASNDRFKDFSFVWSVKGGSRVPADLLSDPRVSVVEPNSDDFLYYLATAKYLINNVTFAPFFVRRPEQRYLNTWHGTPMKTLGRSMKQGIIEYENIERNLLQSTHIMVPNELTRWALIDEHHLDGIYPGATMITGSPRLDALVNDDGSMRSDIRKKLGVLPEEKLVLVAPTWRGGVSSRDLNADALTTELEALAAVPDTRVFYRAHRLTESLIEDLNLPVDVVPHDIDTNDLLSAVDHLVSDYSSIVFDFLVTGRPVTLFVPDEEEYRKDRGLYLDPEDLPFGVARTVGELVEDVERPDFDEAAYLEATQTYGQMEDGQSSARCMDFFLSDEQKGSELNEWPTYVFHASLIPNGIASSVRALFQELVKRQINVVLIVEPHVLRANPDRYRQLMRLPSEVKLVSRLGNLVTTPEEAYIRGAVESGRISPGEDMRETYEQIWRREARRILGDIDVAAAVEWDGYARLWANLVLGIGTDETTHAIWQHNDMKLELSEKFPELAGVFEEYGRFDQIVSVSATMRDVNASFLREGLGIADPGVSVVHNVVPREEIARLAAEPLDADIEKFVEGASDVVLNVGRNSPEKNQLALLEAWDQLRAAYPDARLVIAGDGPLAPNLAAEVSKRGLEGSVMLAGQRRNVLPLMRRADLFVLPSLHEGQPVVLFEAMSVGTPVLASALPGNIEAMEEGYGEIVGTSPQDIASGIDLALRQAKGAYDTALPQNYSSRALDEFDALFS